jgi:anti-anti-sigma regulatory factor
VIDRMDAPVRALSPRHRVSGNLGHESAADFHDRLVDLVQKSHDGVLELDLSGVEHIDAACLGVLRGVSDLLRTRAGRSCQRGAARSRPRRLQGRAALCPAPG